MPSALTLASIGLAALATGVGAVPPEPADRPNIVLVLIDDLGQRDIEPYGSTFHETPALRRLAASGVLFTDAYAACPVCSPTRASVVTGKYPARFPLTDFLKGRRSPKDSPLLPADYKDQLDRDEVTLAEMLRKAGYATAHVGKWHLGGGDFLPEHQGFDLNVAGRAIGSPPGYFWPYRELFPELKETGGEGAYLDDQLTDAAIRFLEQHKDGPFFLQLWHYTVHIPLQARPDRLAKFEAKLKSSPPREGTQNNPHYAAMVESMDHSVGRLLDALDRLGIADNTIVLFSSDNGGLSVKEGPHTPATTNAPLRAGKGYLYEGGIRVPLLIRWPGVTRPGSVRSDVVSSIDFLPTLCEAAGVEPTPSGPIDGISLVPLLRDPTARLEPRSLFWHYPHFSNQGGRPGAALRGGDWKLIEFYETNKAELYNLAEDVGESFDLAERFPDKVRSLRDELRRWRREVNANMPKPNPDYRSGEID